MPRDASEAGGSAVDEEGLSAGGSWLELSVEADAEAVEAVSEILARVAPGGVAVEPGFELVEEGLAARVASGRPAVVRAYLPGADASAARRAVVEARTALGHLQAFGLRPIGDLQTRVVQEEDWADAWKSHFPVLRVGHRLVIRPTWREHVADPGDVVIALDPGMAFGTGLHPTTRLCLAALEDRAAAGEVEGRRVLDVGCGSGILGVAAALLGAASVLGVDTDPVAVEATRANVRLNGLEDRAHARRGSVPVSEPPFDVVLANLIASLLVTLAPSLAAITAPPGISGGRRERGGVLVASGIFVDREVEVQDALTSVGFEVLARRQDGDWIVLVARRRR